ncbi:DnaJ domain-containing protein [Natrarchaeobius oligotrophus]|uniref:Molecular chaperone DnaJ n=1 Tax=Natrarchaeobius chitinivorans TaxID=1679083 RepID=A0A3N6PHP1_NATCH|nr:DnaJ domain-containing protein [Natrarchaeobius chitinivorans]RQG97625.1 molecular chaperone DnaJ [Natrarchaeobius chitinivorans]
MGETYYDVLEVDPDATQAEIRDAYRERVLETHPDHNDDPDATDQFQRVSTAQAVLTDGDERARYDRLGHDAYVGLADGSFGSVHRSDEETPPRGGVDASGSTTTENRSGFGTDAGTGRRRSHHARQRTRRQRETAERTARNGWSFGGGERTGTASRGENGRETNASASSGDAEFRYRVRDWDDDDDVTLRREERSIDHSTAVTVACLWVLYPAFVYASLTPAFSPVVNGILVACTLGVVAYLLTIPRLAPLFFGGWSLIVPLAVVRLSSVEVLSIRGSLVLAFVWIPFGYALAVWWAVRR